MPTSAAIPALRVAHYLTELPADPAVLAHRRDLLPKDLRRQEVCAKVVGFDGR